MKKYLTFFISIFAGLILTAEILNPTISPSTETKNANEEPVAEYVYLQTDKTYYEPGDIIWFTVFVREGFGLKPTSISEVINIELYDGKNNLADNFKLTLKNGSTKGEIVLPENISGGEYVLKAYTNYQLNDSNTFIFEKKIQIQSYNDPQLILHLDFIEKGLSPGMIAHANFSAEDLTGQPIIEKYIQYTVNFASETLHDSCITDSEGKAIITFKIPQQENNENSILNVTIKHKGVTESISRQIPISLGEFTMEFYPESGDWLANYPTKIAFSAVDKYGKPVFVNGKIVDQNNKTIVPFSTYHDGMGIFEIKANGDSKYFAVVKKQNEELKIPLPEIKSSGTSFSLSKLKSDYKITIFSSEKKEAKLTVQLKNHVFLIMKLNLIAGKTIHPLNLDSLPMGVAQITISTMDDVPLAERLVFVNSQKQLNFKIKTNKEKYLPREKVEATVLATDSKGNPITGDLSISVVDDKNISLANDKSGNILSKLLLEADINGEINEPNFYLDSTEVKSTTALDLLMMTRGWRKFVWKNETADHFKTEKTTIKGRIINLKEGKKDSKITIEISPTHQKFETDDEGNFVLTDVDISVQPILIAKYKKKELQYKLTEYYDSLVIDFNLKNDIHYSNIKKSFSSGPEGIKGQMIDQTTGEALPFVNVLLLNSSGERTGQGVVTDFDGFFFIKPLAIGNYQLEFTYIGYEKMRIANIPVQVGKTTYLYPRMQEHAVYLQEVVIENTNGKRNKNKVMETTSVDGISMSGTTHTLESVVITSYTTPLISHDMKSSQVITRTEISHLPTRNISSMVSTLSDVYKTESENGTELHVRGSRANDLVYFIDGVKTTKTPNLPVSSLDQVTVITGGIPANYGDVTGGVVLITTRDYRDKTYYGDTYSNHYYENEDFVFLNEHNKTIFRKGREFPKIIHHEEKKSEVIDDRKTIFFSGNIRLNEKGETKIEFYTNDDVTQFRMIAEGISDEGKVGYAESTLFTQPALSIESKVPDHLTINDQISLPLIIRNNSEKEMEINLNYKISEAFQQGDKGENTLILKPNSFYTIHLNLTTVKANTYGSINVFAYSNKSSFTFKKEIMIVSTGYPVKSTFSSSESKSEFEININDEFDKNIFGEFTVHSDQLSQIIDATSDMIREPHGCFEQVSSSTYPNLLVLRLLKETEKSNEEIENNAMKFIASGYSQLAAYETPENGFSLWGKSPASLPMTAFGLMEFTEMQKVYEGVDSKMLERTKEFILSKKTGDGFFKINEGAKSYSTHKEEIIHCYIVWALSNAKITDEISSEIKMAKTISMKNKDNYCIALTSMALFNSGKTKEAQEMNELLLENQSPDGSWKGINSIMYSSGAIHTETTALSVMALMKSGNANEKEITSGIKYLSKCKSPYYGYGSTQATGLVVQALTEYALLFENVESTESFTVSVNDKSFNFNLTETKIQEAIKQEISTHLKNGKNKINFSFNKNKWIPDYEVNVNYKTSLPENKNSELILHTELDKTEIRLSETVRLKARITNQTSQISNAPLMMIEIPAGLSVQTWQLNQMKEKGQFESYEINANKLVIYLDKLNANEIKEWVFDLKSEFTGTFSTSANYVYPYYDIQKIYWDKGYQIKIR